MKALRFSGHSDDVLHYTVNDQPESGQEADPVKGVHAFLVEDPFGNGLFVCGVYAPAVISGNCWMIGVAPLLETVPLPDWTIRYENQPPGYSPTLVIYAPNDTKITPMAKPQ